MNLDTYKKEAKKLGLHILLDDVSAEEVCELMDSLIDSIASRVEKEAVQRGRDMAVDCILNNFQFSLDELSKSGGEKFQKILSAARTEH